MIVLHTGMSHARAATGKWPRHVGTDHLYRMLSARDGWTLAVTNSLALEGMRSNIAPDCVVSTQAKT
jgi:hypothetical protein